MRHYCGGRVEKKLRNEMDPNGAVKAEAGQHTPYTHTLVEDSERHYTTVVLT